MQLIYNDLIVPQHIKKAKGGDETNNHAYRAQYIY